MSKNKNFKNFKIMNTVGAAGGGALAALGSRYIPVDNKYAKTGIIALAGAFSSAFMKDSLFAGLGDGLIGAASAQLIDGFLSPSVTSGVGLLPGQGTIGASWINRRAFSNNDNQKPLNAGQRMVK